MARTSILHKSLAEYNITSIHEFIICARTDEQQFDPIWSLRENMFDTSVCWCTCHLGARQLHQFQVHAERRIWHAAENHVQPVGSWEGNCLKGIIQTLLGPTFLCLNLRPRSARREAFFDHFRPFADSCLRCLAFGWNKTIPVSFEFKIIPKI